MKQTFASILLIGGLALGIGKYAFDTSTKLASANAAPAVANVAATNSSTAMTSPLAGPNQKGRLGAPGVFGAVTAIASSTLTVEDQRQQSSVTVALTGSTIISKEITLALADVPVGETISAFGIQSGDVFTATQVQIGQANALGGRGPGGPPPAMGSQGNGPQGHGPQGDMPQGNAQPGNGPQGRGPQGHGPQGHGPQGNGPQGNGPQPGHGGGARLVGTVEEVSSDTITVQTTDGTTVQLKLASNGRIVAQVAGTSADITVGTYMMARGTQDGATLTATNIMILLAPTQQP